MLCLIFQLYFEEVKVMIKSMFLYYLHLSHNAMFLLTYQTRIRYKEVKVSLYLSLMFLNDQLLKIIVVLFILKKNLKIKLATYSRMIIISQTEHPR